MKLFSQASWKKKYEAEFSCEQKKNIKYNKLWNKT